MVSQKERMIGHFLPRMVILNINRLEKLNNTSKRKETGFISKILLLP